MSEIEKAKHNIVSQLRQLCAHCSTRSARPHRCPIEGLAARVESIRGIPLIVNNEFKGVLLPHV